MGFVSIARTTRFMGVLHSVVDVIWAYILLGGVGTRIASFISARLHTSFIMRSRTGNDIDIDRSASKGKFVFLSHETITCLLGKVP